MKPYSNILVLAILSYLLLSCEGKFEPKENLGPQAVELQFPEPDEVCQEGSSQANGEINVPFRWGSVAEATSYRLEVNGQDSNDQRKVEVPIAATDLVEVEVPLQPGTLYTWFVYTLKDKQETKSAERSFYSRGVADIWYVPFPATISVVDNGGGNATISWASTDVDDDLIGYDVYLSTENPPALLLENTTDTSLQDVFAIGVPYYVAVVAKDAAGNSSVVREEFSL